MFVFSFTVTTEPVHGETAITEFIQDEDLSKYTSVSYDGENEVWEEFVTEESLKTMDESDLIIEGTEGTGNISPFELHDSLNGEDSDAGYAPSSIIGTDERFRIPHTATLPFRAIVFLEMTFPDGSNATATGFLTGSDAILTAGHAIYNHDRGGWAQEVTAAPGRDGSLILLDEYNHTSLHTVSGWVEDRIPQLDFGVIRIDGHPGNTMGTLTIGTSNIFDTVGQTIHVTGYPGFNPGHPMYPSSSYRATMWSSEDNLMDENALEYWYLNDTTGGQSGSPVYIIRETGSYVIAIHVRGANTYNVGVRITPGVLQNVANWSS